MRDPQAISMNEDERLFPIWSIVAASTAFLLVEYYFWIVFPGQRHHVTAAGPPHLYESVVGAVGRDLLSDDRVCQQRFAAPRMSARFWMLICFVMPGGIGAVLYFLLRSRWFQPALPAGRMSRATSTSARNATISSRQTAAIVSARCAPLTSSARGVVMSWPGTTCRRG